MREGRATAGESGVVNGNPLFSNQITRLSPSSPKPPTERRATLRMRVREPFSHPRVIRCVCYKSRYKDTPKNTNKDKVNHLQNIFSDKNMDIDNNHHFATYYRNRFFWKTKNITIR